MVLAYDRIGRTVHLHDQCVILQGNNTSRPLGIGKEGVASRIAFSKNGNGYFRFVAVRWIAGIYDKS